jgi:hypothetical protein
MLSLTDFPKIQSEGYDETSKATPDYNCIAWAANDQTRWWWPGLDSIGKEAYWPPRAPRKRTLKAFALAFKSLGYEKCKDGALEDGFEKIAIYAKDSLPTHAARQLGDGKWTHKIGSNVDVSCGLSAVEDGIYGSPVRFMRRKIARTLVRTRP